MITRNGFVSNSSSSSFIIGIANVTGKTKGEFKVEFDETSRTGIKDLKYPLHAKKIDDETFELYLTSFMESKVSTKVKNGDEIIYLKGTGPDNDSAFWNGDYYDYDIDLSDFNEPDQEKYSMILSYKGEVDYGAGRNG